MKLYQSKVLDNLDKFPKYTTPEGPQLCRGPDGMYLLWKVIEYFKPKNILEIGFFGGQSLGIIYESVVANGKDSIINTVDINFEHKDWFNSLFPHNQINFINVDTKNLNISEFDKLDFVLIDGNHDYDYVLNDFNKCLPLLSEDSILCMDDYQSCPGVQQVIKENLVGQHGFVPFMCGPQEMFFHHITHDATEFLDHFVQHNAKNFLSFNNNTNYHGSGAAVMEVSCPFVFYQSNQIFVEALKFYQI